MGFGEGREKPLAPFMGVLQKGSPSLPQVLALPSPIKDPHALASRATKLLEQASAWYADVKKL